MAESVATFVFWDVQHGSACYISTPNGKNIVIDLGVGSYGSKDQTFSPLLHLKNKWKVQQLDAVVITHPHRDHLDDIENFDALSPRLLSRPRHLTHDQVRVGNKADDSEILDKYFEIDDRYTGNVGAGEDPFDSNVNGGLSIQRFFPTKCAVGNLNNHSAVIVASYAGCKIIIPGDNEALSWNELLENPAFVSAIKGADILVAAHHGREAGFCDNIFKHFSPRLVIISDGPSTETSATDKYCGKSFGWKVHKRSGESEEKKCVTTRSNGVIVVKFGMNDGEKRFIEVTID